MHTQNCGQCGSPVRFERALTSQLDHVGDLFRAIVVEQRWHLCPGLSTSPLTTMADTKRDDPDSFPTAKGDTSHEMRALPVAAQTSRENLPAIPDPGHGEDGGEAHDIARASTLQTKGPSDCNDVKSVNVVVPQDSEEDQDQGGFTVSSTPITGQGQGPPSFAQSEFYTVNLIRIPTVVVLVIELSVHVDCPSSTP